MPQQLLHHLELSPHASQQGRVGVTERMPSESLLNSDSLSCRTYVFAQDRLAPVRSSASIALACKKDRKSTRLNSSHTVISYAVFCLKKKKKKKIKQKTATSDKDNNC